MIKKRINRYAVLFKLFFIEEIVGFLKEVNKIPNINYSLNENSLTNSLFNEKQIKNKKKEQEFSSKTIEILEIIKNLRDSYYIKEICRYLEYEVYLRSNKMIQYSDNQNCGIVSIQNGKKIDLSLVNYLDKMKDKIIDKMEENHG